jgi:uncharacterized membrane protein HdeD (DUF308 family)
MANNELSLFKRITAPTPRVFKIFRALGLCLAAAGSAIIAAPTMPVVLVSIAGYMMVAGGVMSAISQLTVDGN